MTRAAVRTLAMAKIVSMGMAGVAAAGPRALPLEWSVGPANGPEAEPERMVPATVPGAAQHGAGTDRAARRGRQSRGPGRAVTAAMGSPGRSRVISCGPRVEGAT